MTTVVEQVNAPVPAEPAKPAKKAPDVRYLALRNFAISLSVFNILGYTVLGFEQPWLWPFLALATGYTTEIVFEVISAWATRSTPRFTGRGARGFMEFMLPSHITALAVNMLLYANDQWWPIMFGVIVAVAQKHFLKAPVNGRWRHFMNPSNFGITVTLLAFGTWVSIAPPYQFTEYANSFFRVTVPMLILMAGTVINAVLTKRVLLIMGWVGGFAIQALIRHWIWDVALFTAFGAMSGVAFVLYTNYMVTDPGTTPSKGRAQFMFGSSIAVVYALLMVGNVVYTLFYATTIVCGLRGLGWWVAHLLRARKAAGATDAQTAPAGA
ncbi:enediyne biosynthesis protein [Spirillospora sp. NPDC052269]